MKAERQPARLAVQCSASAGVPVTLITISELLNSTLAAQHCHPPTHPSYFSYDVNGVDRNSPTISMFASPGRDNPVGIVLMQSWQVTGGGVSTYAIWGGKVPTEASATDCIASGCSRSLLYMGKGFQGQWRTSGGTIDASTIFATTRYAQIPNLVLWPENYPTYGTTYFGGPNTPFAISQTVTLTVGARYRLQWWQSSEDGSQASPLW